MFIKSKFSKYGVETPEALVNHLYMEGISSICLIDEYGLGILPFLKACRNKKINCSVAIPFISFFEDTKRKEKGYFVASNYEVYKLIKERMKDMSTDFIPFITEREIKDFHKMGGYCFVRCVDKYLQKGTGHKINIKPVVFLTEEKKISYIEQLKKVIGLSFEEGLCYLDSVIFVEGVSSDSLEFLRKFEENMKCIDVTDYLIHRKN